MKKFFLGLFSFFVISFSAQTQGFAANIGYSTIRTNALYVGAEYAYRIDPDNWKGFSTGVGAYLRSYGGNTKIIPEAHINYSTFLLLSEISFTPYSINPSVGINFMNVMRFKFGYSWKLGNNDYQLKGFTFGLNFLIGNSGFYDKFGLSIL